MQQRACKSQLFSFYDSQEKPKCPSVDFNVKWKSSCEDLARDVINTAQLPGRNTSNRAQKPLSNTELPQEPSMPRVGFETTQHQSPEDRDEY